jgi:Reverse transcriptase (RNA-dependent DNA polymerase)/gag-polypeptide of LTR copia-type/GAG-pre-integrase domain
MATLTTAPLSIRSTTPITFSHQIRINLDNENFLLWKSQVLPVLKGHGLAGFLDGSRSAPSETTTNTAGTLVPNPEFEAWQQQDQLILAWIFSSISPSILSQIVRCQTTAAVWSTLTQIYSSQSMAKKLDLKFQLQTLKKGSLTCDQFINKMQALADRLRSIGTDVPDSELVMYAAQGLGSDYDSFVTALSMRISPPSLVEFNSLLLSHEARIQTNLRSSSTTAVHLTTHTANQSTNSEVGDANNSVFYTSNNRNGRGRGKGRYNNQKGRGRGRHSYQSNNFQPSSSQEQQIQCQICARWGHGALSCYHRFDIRHTSSTTPQSDAFTSSSPAVHLTTQSAQPHQALIAEPTPTSDKGTWYLDSGASTHVTFDLNSLSNSYPYSGLEAVHIGNGKALAIANKGSATLVTDSKSLTLNNILHVPEITKNLLSVSQLTVDNNVNIEFSSDCCFIKDKATNQILLHGILHKGLYKLLSAQNNAVFQVSHSSTDQWHYRLGHCSSSVLDLLLKNKSISSQKPSKASFCSDCHTAKAHRLPFTPSTTIATKPLEVIHSDIWGPAPVLSKKGHRYYVCFIDEFSRFTWIYTCASKSDVLSIFAQFKAKVENLLDSTIKLFQCDGGSEFKPIMRQFPEISFQISCPYTPEQNGLAERKHRHIVELGLANMTHASLPLHFWDYIFESVVFVINRLPSKVIEYQSPFEKLFKTKPDYNMLQVLGCSCYPLLRPYNSHKLENRAERCLFLGYSNNYKGYYCLNLHTNRLYISRHVVFDESSFPCADKEYTNISSSDSPPIISPLVILQNMEGQTAHLPPHTNTAQPSSPQPAPTTSYHASDTTLTLSIPTSTPDPTTHNSSSSTSHHMITRTKTKNLKPKEFPNHQLYSITHLASDKPIEPTCYSQAIKDPNWRQAMAREITALAQNATWDLVPPSQGAHVIGAKWVFKIKLRSDGSVERYKARLVAKGYNQQEGLDYMETFSPVVKPATIRIVLTIALSHHWPIHQLDVNNAFLHGDLAETVYMEQPPGFPHPQYPSHVCKLKKALYGLKQAPRAWFSKLKNFLLSQGFCSSKADTSLFMKINSTSVTYIMVYVDDILLTGSCASIIQSLLTSLHQHFSLKNLGTLNYFLGIEVTAQNGSLHLSQTRYLQSILDRTNMTAAKPIQTPMIAGLQMSKYEGTKLIDPQLYRSTVGALQYATITRPDLTFAVNKASQFMHEPTEAHWQMVKRILRYVKGTLSHGLLFKSAPNLSLHAYCDADWAGCPDDRRSTTGFAVYLGPNLISWSSKKQPTVSRSSTEAEYRSLAVTTSELIWVQSLLQELQLPVTQSPTLWCDNLGATFLASNPVYHARTKHIELDYHFVREKVDSKQLNVQFICSADQLGDFFTKSIGITRFQLLRNKLHIFPKMCSLRGADKGTETDQLDSFNTAQTGDDKSASSSQLR